jgi:hypothetical protein
LQSVADALFVSFTPQKKPSLIPTAIAAKADQPESLAKRFVPIRHYGGKRWL